jgi:hypothetical protein
LFGPEFDGPLTNCRLKNGKAEMTEKYEAVSKEWVAALAEHIIEQYDGIHFVQDDMIWSTEYTDAPTHLLRNPGDTSVGFRYVIKDGKLRVEDGFQYHRVDIAMRVAYDPVAYALRIGDPDYHDWLKKEAPRLGQEGKITIIGNNAYTRAAFAFLWPVRNNFYAKHTA